MTYHDNQNVQDVQYKIDEAEDALRSVHAGTVEDLAANLDAVAEAIHEIEGELRYVDDEMTEAKERDEDWVDIIDEYGHPDELPILTEEESAEYAKLKEENDKLRTQVTNLEHYHANQGDVIRALLAKLKQFNDETTPDAIGTLLFEATQNNGVVLIEEDKA